MKIFVVLIALIGVMLAIPKPAPSMTQGSAGLSIEEILFMSSPDTFACPNKEEIFDYLSNGLTEVTNSCSPLVWADVEYSESLGEFSMAYADWFSVDYEAAPSDTFVEVYRIRFEGVELFAIRDMLDEHFLDQNTGKRPGVVYAVWEIATEQI